MLRSDLVYSALRERKMKFTELAEWLGMWPRTLHLKLADLSGGHLTLKEAESLMIILGLSADAFLNQDSTISKKEIEKRVSESKYKLRWGKSE